MRNFKSFLYYSPWISLTMFIHRNFTFYLSKFFHFLIAIHFQMTFLLRFEVFKSNNKRILGKPLQDDDFAPRKYVYDIIGVMLLVKSSLVNESAVVFFFNCWKISDFNVWIDPDFLMGFPLLSIHSLDVMTFNHYKNRMLILVFKETKIILIHCGLWLLLHLARSDLISALNC